MRKKYVRKPEFQPPVTYRPAGVTEMGLAFVGHEISSRDNLINQFLHYDQLYTIRQGENSPFFLGLLEGKIRGTRCPSCGDLWVPPRIHCWNRDCNLKNTEWVDVPPTARLHTWTVAGWSGRSSLKRLPIVLVYAVFKGSKVAIANELRGVDPWDVEFDMPLKATFIPPGERKGLITDFYFVPHEDWAPSPMNPEKERIKKLVQPVYDWIKTLK